MRPVLAIGFALLIASLGPSTFAAPAQPATSKTVGAWTATCDNIRDCVIVGGSDDGDGLFYVRIAMAAAAGAAPEVKVVLAASDPIPDLPGVIAIALKGGAKPVSFVVAAKKDDADGAAIVGLVSDSTFLAAIAQSQSIEYAAGAMKGRLALSGAASALRFVDDRQGRTGTPSALIARGMTPIGQVPPPPLPPDVQAAPVVATPVPSPTISRALVDMAKPACDPEVVEAHSDVAAWTLGPDRQLVAIPCEEGATNVSSALFVTNAKGEEPRPAILAQPSQQGDAETDNVVVNYDFNVRTLTLSSLDKGRGLGDCGTMSSWVWTGEIFALLRASRLEACPGALPEDWPPIYVAKRK